MSKKGFKAGFDSLLGGGEAPAKQNHETAEVPKKRGPKQKPENFGDVRATFIVKEDHLTKLKALGYWDRKSIKEVINEALEGYFETKGQKHVEKAVKEFSDK